MAISDSISVVARFQSSLRRCSASPLAVDLILSTMIEPVRIDTKVPMLAAIISSNNENPLLNLIDLALSIYGFMLNRIVVNAA